MATVTRVLGSVPGALQAVALLSHNPGGCYHPFYTLAVSSLELLFAQDHTT